MSDASATDWRELREFAGTDLTKSYILSWHLESETLFVDIDVLLTEAHPFYEKPRPAEKTCIRPAIIEFPFCQDIKTLTAAKKFQATSVDRLQHGAVAGLQRRADGRYKIDGKFGSVLIDAERPLLRLKNP